MENENQNNGNSDNLSTSTTNKKRSHNFFKYIWKHRGASVFFVLFFVSFISGIWNAYELKKEKNLLTEQFTAQKDSLQISDYALITKVFSWAVRSDMMRNNYDQANQYLKQIVKEPHIQKVFAIDVEKNVIVLSTDKNEVGMPVSDILLLQTNNAAIQYNSNSTRFIIPITGLNKKIGIAVIDTDLKK